MDYVLKQYKSILLTLFLGSLLSYGFWRYFALQTEYNLFKFSVSLHQYEGSGKKAGFLGHSADKARDNDTQSMFEKLSKMIEIKSEQEVEPNKLQDLWMKNHNTTVYQFQNYTPWKSLYIQGENQVYTMQQLKVNFIRMLEGDQAHCESTVRAGSARDGGWHVCVSAPYTPREEQCLVYSLGINYDFSFDIAMTDKYKCTVRAYDPSMDKDTYAKLKQGDSMHIKDGLYFYKIGIGARSLRKGETTVNEKGWYLQSFGNMMKANGDGGKIIDMLKMDVENSEWMSFEAMFEENSLRNVKQLSFEIHIQDNNFKKYFQTLMQLEKLGFRRYLMNRNQYYNTCYELYYLNMNFL